MSVREYIGARYVPLFMGDWDNTNTYEPLSIVQYQGNSYTSRQYVPTGIEITNEDYWAETGSYNAQVEQYRQEVQEIQDDISDVGNVLPISDFSSESTVKDAIDAVGATLPISDFSSESTVKDAIDAVSNTVSEFRSAIEELEIANIDGIDIYMFDGSGDNNICTKLIQADGASVLVETGAPSDANSIVNFILSHGVTTLDALILTHMHGDHVDNWRSIIDNFCDENTKIYKQMTPSNSNGEISMFNDKNNAISTYLASLNYPPMIIPVNGSVHKFGDNEKLEIQFYNTDSSNISAYDASWGNGGTTYYPGEDNAEKSTLNNYSLCVFFTCGSSTYFDCGDIEGEGQKQNAQYMRPVNVALNPHHFYNKMGYEEFYDKLMPEIWLVANHFITEQDEGVPTLTFSLSYLSRYLRMNGDSTPIVTNVNNNVEIKIRNNKVQSFSGRIVDQDYNPDNRQITPHFASMLPPDVYKDNPYFVLSSDFTLEYLQSEMRRRYNPALIPICGYIPESTSSVYGASSPFAVAVRELWSPLDLGNNLITMYLDGYLRWHFKMSYLQSPYTDLILFAASGNTPTNISFANELRGPLTKVVTGPFSNADVVSSSDPNIAYLLRSTVIAAVLSTGAVIPMIRQGKFSDGISSNFAGSLVNTTGTQIYSAQLLSNRTVYIRSTKISDGTVDTATITIASFHIIC